MSGNHNGDLKRALELVEAAKKAGADAIKLQTYTADTITINHDSPDFKIQGGLWDGYTLYELYNEAHTPWEWHEALFRKGHEIGLTVFSSPFDFTSVDFLETFDVPAYKIASFEIIDIPLIEKVASTGKPIIISTGMADEIEIKEAVDAAQGAGAKDIALMHCVSGYPTPIKESNLLTIPDLQKKYNKIVGLSDHTNGILSSVAGIALGAAIVEKHLTLNRSDGGPDAIFSLEPQEMGDLVEGCHVVWQAKGMAGYERKQSEIQNVIFRRSLYAVKDIKQGEKITNTNIKSIRPGYGLAPKYLPKVLNSVATQDIKFGTPLDWPMINIE